MRRMPTHLTFDAHLDALTTSGAALHDTAKRAGLATPVPTCPDWDVAALVTHQGMVHRWAAANLRQDAGHDPDASIADAAAAPDLLAWYLTGLDELVNTLQRTPSDVDAMVFLKDAPAPLRFWARRQAHETTIHWIDAVSATMGEWPSTSRLPITAGLAADGIDELVCGFVPRRKSKLRSSQPYTVVIHASDTGHTWTLRVSEGPVEASVGETADADAVLSGTAVQLYTGLWNRGNEVAVEGRADVLDQWREQVRIQ